MSAPVVTYYMTVNSPWSYMGAQRLADIAKANGAILDVRPVRFGPLFERTGGLPLPKRAPERRAYRLVELKRWRDFLDMPLVIEPAYFPADDRLAAHAIIAAGNAGLDDLALSREIGRAQWELERDIAHKGTIAAACGRVGFELSELGDLDRPGLSDQFDENTEQAVRAGAFGFPTYVIDGELFWGQDRLDFVARTLENQT